MIIYLRINGKAITLDASEIKATSNSDIWGSTKTVSYEFYCKVQEGWEQLLTCIGSVGRVFINGGIIDGFISNVHYINKGNELYDVSGIIIKELKPRCTINLETVSTRKKGVASNSSNNLLEDLEDLKGNFYERNKDALLYGNWTE